MSAKALCKVAHHIIDHAHLNLKSEWDADLQLSMLMMKLSKGQQVKSNY